MERDLCAQLHLQATEQHRAQQGSRDTFSRDIRQHSNDVARRQLHEIVKIAADVARRLRKAVQAQIFDPGKRLRQQAALRLFGQREFLFELLALLDAFDHFHAFEDPACLLGKLIEDPFIQTG